MFRMIRRAPWIALGAAGAYFLDAQSGARRRRDVVDRARAWWDQWRAAPGFDGPVPIEDDPPLPASLPFDRVVTRAEGAQAEETAAGVPEPARTAMARTILQESEERVTDRALAGAERRRSEETVEPQGATGAA